MAINDDGKSWAATGTATAGWTASGIDGDGGLGGGRYGDGRFGEDGSGRQCGFGATAGGWTAAGVGDGGLDGGRYGDGRCSESENCWDVNIIVIRSLQCLYFCECWKQMCNFLRLPVIYFVDAYI